MKLIESFKSPNFNERKGGKKISYLIFEALIKIYPKGLFSFMLYGYSRHLQSMVKNILGYRPSNFS